MEDFEQKTDSAEEEKTTSSEISCAEEATENCIEMTANQDNEPMTEASAEAEWIRNPEVERPDSRGKKILVPLLSFFVPVLLFGLAWANNGITYGGNVTPLVYDMNVQYMPFIASLRYLFSGDYSLLFNWNVNLGGNYLALFTYYLASPINLISLLFDLRDMPDAIYVITLIKIGLCGLNLSTFLRFGVSKGKVRWRDILFASCYALMSYNVMYSLCVMWLDGVLMMPLILLGVEKLLEGKKGLIYFMSIAATFYCNFYISYAVGIFTAVYFLAGVIRRLKKGQVKSFFAAAARFAFLTITAAGLCMPFILPTLKSVSGGYGSFDVSGKPSDEMYSFTLVDLLKKLLPQQYDSLEYTGLPSIFCGSVMVVLCILFFLQKRGARHKIAGLLLLALPVAGFLCPTIDFALHGFQYPHSYMYRYAFTFSFAVLLLGYQSLEKINLQGKIPFYLASILAMYTVVELVMNGSVLIAGLHEESNYKVRAVKNLQYDLQKPLADLVRDREEIVRTGFIGTSRGDCSGIIYNVLGTECFSSTFNDAVNQFMGFMGSESYAQVTTARGNTPFTNCILGIKYLISAEYQNHPYELIETASYEDYEIFLFENTEVLPIGYSAPVVTDIIQNNDNPFESQNTAAGILGYQNGGIYRPLSLDRMTSDDCIQFTFRFEEGEQPYLYIANLENEKGEKHSTCRITVDDSIEFYVEYSDALRFFDLSGLASGKQHTISIYNAKQVLDENIILYALNTTKLAEFVDQKREESLHDIVYSGNRIVGQHTFADNQFLFTSLPNDGNWQVSVDGEQAVTGTALGTFLCVFAPEGEHEISFLYWPAGLTAGLWMMAASTLLLLVALIVEITLSQNGSERILVKKLQ